MRLEHDEDTTVLEQMVNTARDVELEAVPDSVANQAALCVLDTVGCMFGGVQTPEAQKIASAEKRQYGEPKDWPPEVVARVLGYFGDILELNDLIGGHASIGVVTSAVTSALYSPTSGPEFFRAIIAGIEATGKVYDSAVASLKPYSESGMVVPGHFNAYGAAVTVSLLDGLNIPQSVNAVAIAGSLTSWGPAEVTFGEGGTIKPILFGGSPASSAIQAATYASEDISGPWGLIESPIGLMAALTSNYDRNSLRNGVEWYLQNPQRKLHAACGYTHPSIEAVSGLGLSEAELSLIETIEVAIPQFYIETVAKSGPPVDANDARFHLNYLVALAAQGRVPIAPEHTTHFAGYLSEGRTRDLMDKVKVVPLTDVDLSVSKPYDHAEVTVSYEGGSSDRAVCTAPRGAAGNPLSETDVIDKFRRLVSPIFADPRSGVLIEDILALRYARDVRPTLSHVFGSLMDVVGQTQART